MTYAPQKVYDKDGKLWTLREAKNARVVYEFTEGHGCGIVMSPQDIELEFTRQGRPEPTTKIHVQGKWDCAAASLSMLLGVNPFFARNAMGKAGWRNDDRGASSWMEIEGARNLGVDLLEIHREDFKPGLGPCTVSIPSLNYKGRYHAVTWNGKETLDPNWGREGRKFWGCEWSPWTMGAKWGLLKLPFNLSAKERAEHDKLIRSKRWEDYRYFKSQILCELKKEAA
jgi:hypothetical protein